MCGLFQTNQIKSIVETPTIPTMSVRPPYRLSRRVRFTRRGGVKTAHRRQAGGVEVSQHEEGLGIGRPRQAGPGRRIFRQGQIEELHARKVRRWVQEALGSLRHIHVSNTITLREVKYCFGVTC